MLTRMIFPVLRMTASRRLTDPDSTRLVPNVAKPVVIKEANYIAKDGDTGSGFMTQRLLL